jgi:hypothetical protein
MSATLETLLAQELDNPVSMAGVACVARQGGAGFAGVLRGLSPLSRVAARLD